MSTPVKAEEVTNTQPMNSGNGSSLPHAPVNGNGNGHPPSAGNWRESFKSAAPSYPAISPRPAGSATPTSTRQEEMWVLCQFEDANPCYNIYLAWRMRGSLNMGAMQKTMDELVARHES